MSRDLYVEMAKANGAAIQGLNPKITVWTTGDSKGDGFTKPIADLMKMMPPLFTTINDQTGIQPPDWLAKLAPKEEK